MDAFGRSFLQGIVKDESIELVKAVLGGEDLREVLDLGLQEPRIALNL